MKAFGLFFGCIAWPTSIYMTYCMWSFLGLPDWKFIALETLIIMPTIIMELIRRIE